MSDLEKLFLGLPQQTYETRKMKREREQQQAIAARQQPETPSKYYIDRQDFLRQKYGMGALQLKGEIGKRINKTVGDFTKSNNEARRREDQTELKIAFGSYKGQKIKFEIEISR